MPGAIEVQERPICHATGDLTETHNTVLLAFFISEPYYREGFEVLAACLSQEAD